MNLLYYAQGVELHVPNPVRQVNSHPDTSVYIDNRCTVVSLITLLLTYTSEETVNNHPHPPAERATEAIAVRPYCNVFFTPHGPPPPAYCTWGPSLVTQTVTDEVVLPYQPCAGI